MLTVLPRKNFGVGDEIAMHGTRQFDRELNWPVIRNGGEFQLGHRVGLNSGKARGRDRD